jgi:poly-gamma-glutamate synthesis protein (capsule biosynthesis protein)
LLVIAALGGGAGYAFRAPLASLLGRSEERPRAAPSPTTSLPPSPSPSPSPSPERERLVVHGTGDVNLDPAYIPTFRSRGYRYAWTGLKGLFKRDDLTIINLECPASELGASLGKEFTFRCDPKALPIAKRFGVEVANQGNNHSGDLGKEALLDSRRNLKDAGIASVGTGKDHRQAAKPAILEIGGWTIAVVGFGGIVPEPGWIAAEDNPGMADGDDIPSMVRTVKRAAKAADLVFVSIHWGVELDLKPRPDDVERARAMIDAGADGIFGHHAHRLQPMERYKGRPIFWGLGNFVWPSRSAPSATTAVARIVVQPDGRVKGRLLPAYIEDHGHPVLR